MSLIKLIDKISSIIDKNKTLWIFYHFDVIHVNPLQPNVSFLYDLKRSENQKFLDVFRDFRNETFT